MKKKIIGIMLVVLILSGCGKIPKLENGQEAVVSLDEGAISVDDLYTEMKKGMPSIGENYKNGEVEGKVVSLNLLKKTATIETKTKSIIEVQV